MRHRLMIIYIGLLFLLIPTSCVHKPLSGEFSQEGKQLYQKGQASWYGQKFHGRTTANGEKYDMNAMTAAHKTLPFGTILWVRDPRSGRAVRVRVNDRGPYIKGRVIDLSKKAAEQLGLISKGVGFVEVWMERARLP